MGPIKNLSVLTVFSVICGVAHSAQISSLHRLITFQNREQLDDEGKVFLAWEYDNETDIITFEMEVATTGFVGLGISPGGSMEGADIFIAGVHDNGTTYSLDCIGVGFVTPKIDEHEDWTLITAMEAVGKTFLKFSRLIDTCDDEDYAIGVDTTRLIWAYGDTDNIVYHTAARRGAKAVNLIGTPIPELDLEGLSRFEMAIDMVMPSLDTAYWCSYHKGPILTTKHHVVAFDALLDGLDALAHTHHFILKNCFLPPGHNETLDEVFGPYTADTGFLGGMCYDPYSTFPPLEQYCIQDLFVWAKGGKIMTFPENVGYPLGEGDNAGKQLYYMLEIHYDNPDEVEDLKFKTGLQFYYTDELREQDAGLLAVGHMTNPILTIPPNVDDFVILGQCDPSCTEWGIKPEEGITIFNALLHAHMSGRKLKLRHFRGNVELPWIDYDNHYDFDYQQNKPIPGTQILPGDRLIYECTYSSKWDAGKAVVGGLSSREEMCITFLWHYPRQAMSQCFSQTPFAKHIEDFGITEVHDEPAVGGDIIYIDEPAYMRGPYRESISLFNNWTDEFVAQYQYNHRYLGHEGSCSTENLEEYHLFYETTYPENMIEYVPVDVCTPITDPATGTTTVPTTTVPTTTVPTTTVPTTVPTTTVPTTVPTTTVPTTVPTTTVPTTTVPTTTANVETTTPPEGTTAGTKGITHANFGIFVVVLTYFLL